MQLTWLGASLFMIFVDLLDIPPHDLYICNGFPEFSEGLMSVTSVTRSNWRISWKWRNNWLCLPEFAENGANTIAECLFRMSPLLISIPQCSSCHKPTRSITFPHDVTQARPPSSLFLNDFAQEKVSSPQSSISYVFKLQFLALKRMPTDIHDVRSVNNWTFFSVGACWKTFFRRRESENVLRKMCWHLHLTLEWKVIVIWKLMLQNWPRNAAE